MTQYSERYEVPSFTEVERAIKRLEVGPREAWGMRFYYSWARARLFMVKPRIHFGDAPMSFWTGVQVVLCVIAVSAFVIMALAL